MKKRTKLKSEGNFFFYVIRFIHYIIILNIFQNIDINIFLQEIVGNFFLSIYIFRR